MVTRKFTEITESAFGTGCAEERSDYFRDFRDFCVR